jgi:hypothetical protein
VSPAKGRKKVIPKQRDRKAILLAVGGAAAVVVLTLLAIWGMRPGDDFDGSDGGILSRQPRVSWLAVGCVVALGAFVYWAMKGAPKNSNRKRTILACGSVGILLLAGVLGFFWPGGLLHTYQPTPDLSDQLPTDTTVGLPLETSTPLSVDPNATTVPADPNATTVPADPNATTLPVTETTTAGADTTVP